LTFHRLFHLFPFF